jgi:4-amino-4-deoxy-L-arabinose transferase-like glycosyltransferase
MNAAHRLLSIPHDPARYQRTVWILISVLILGRLACAGVTPLAYDEAYYWLWSKHLAGGYYDHPPMIALFIRLGTWIAGDTRLGLRLVCMLAGIPATWAIWRSAQILFQDARLAATAALFFNLTLIVSGGTLLATIDAPLMVASTFVLFFLAKVSENRQGAWWLAVGAAVGGALLSKYSALFFGVSIVAWLLIVPGQRRWLATPWPWLGGLLAILLFLPVIVWNAEHDWVSFIKQFGRAAIDRWRPYFLGEYLGGQLGLATPPIFVLGALGLFAFGQGRGGSPTARVLLGALVWPLTLYFAWHSLHARVEANWTAPIYPAFALAAAAAAHGMDWHGRTALLVDWARRLAVPLGIAITFFLYLQGMFGIIPLGAADATARQLGPGWPALGAQIDALRMQVRAPAILTTSYATTSWLAFYLPTRPPVVQVNERIRWINAPEPDGILFQGPLLYVCMVDCGEADIVRARYERFDEIARMPRTRHGVQIETYVIYRVEGLRGDPLDRTPAPELRR